MDIIVVRFNALCSPFIATSVLEAAISHIHLRVFIMDLAFAQNLKLLIIVLDEGFSGGYSERM